ncbi:MAG TPA: hypothetical protein PK199_01910 [Bacteroidales bacterium]|nr:hypothetical protein [Bacteroidales bacterium]
MKEIIFKIFNPIPLKNRKMRVWVNQFFSILIAIIILFYQYLLAGKVVEFDNVSIYSNQKTNINIDEIKLRLQKHNIEFNRGVDVFLPISEKQYNFWTYYFFKGTLGLNQLVLNRIFINPNLPKTRKIEDVLLHELAHSYLKQEYGYVKALRMPTWKNEGFCEYVSESSSMEKQEGIHYLMNEQKEDSLLLTNSIERRQYEYFKYRLMFEYLIEKKKMTPKQIIETEIDIKLIESEIKLTVSS